MKEGGGDGVGPVTKGRGWSFRPAPVVTLGEGGQEQADAAMLHQGVNDVQLFKDWMGLRAYCFAPSTGLDHPHVEAKEVPPHLAEVLVMMLKVGPQQLVAAGAGVIPMTQNVRGGLFRMAGMRGVSCYPESRRKGHVSALMKSALGLMRDHAVPFSALYPFKASFYERMGYVCVHSKRKVVFSPAIFAGLRPSPALRLERVPAAGFDKNEYVNLLARLQKKVHGFARFADETLEKHMDWSEKVIPHWAVVVRDHKGIAGVLGYTLGPFMTGTMKVDVFAYASVAARTALLSWIGSHTDQAKEVTLIISPDEDFENLVADAAFHITSVEILKPQMARVVSVKGLEGLPVGGDDGLQLDFTLLDPFFPANHQQRYRFTVHQGRLRVQHRDKAEASGDHHDSDDGAGAQLDVRGLTALVFGVVKEGADEIEGRGWGNSFPKATRRVIKAMFPPTTRPLLYENF